MIVHKKKNLKKLWEEAKKIIPGGNMLLSKRPEMFLPGIWPAYFSKTKGCYIWDINGNKFVDMSLMGVGTNILGYSNSEVDAAVKKVVANGNMSTLNCPEELYLAKKLIEIHSWAQMVKFTRTGGEANAVAVRIARSASKKDNVAICGYHGWHDWYLASNLKNKSNLNKHLLNGLETNGVPSSLANTIFPFEYNNIEEIKKIVKRNNIGTIIMEVSRNILPKNNFLKKIRMLTKKHKIILIFDECTSGFRQTYGGLHKFYNIEPDIAIFGKALGNGYAINAIIGKKEFMKYAQSSFISSTFWTERIGPVAALKTLEIMKKTKSWEVVTKKGNYIREQWKKIAKKNNINIEISGIPSISRFTFKSKNHLLYKALITQIMLKKNILATDSIYLSIAHKKKIIDKYLFELNKIFKIISQYENGKKIKNLKKLPVPHTGFQRLN
jgi:glutamate-1-semialdehyde 2,1-aminomutase